MGGPLRKSNYVRQVFRPALTRAVKLAAETGEDFPTKVRFHDLRHTHASALVSSGQNLKAVSRRLGHATVEVTLRVYSHLMPADDAKLADASQSLFS